MLLAYLVVDYSLQTQKFYNWKFSSFAGRMLHVASFFVLAIFLCRDHLSHDWVNMYGITMTGVPAIALITVLHLFIDELFKMTRYAHITNYSAGLTFVLHNLLQIGVLFFFTPDLLVDDLSLRFGETWVLILTGFFLMFRFTDAMIFAFEKDLCKFRHLPECPLPTSDIAFLSRLHRFIFYFIMLIPGYFFVVFIALWVWATRYAAKQRILDISPFSYYTGTAFALFVGYIIRTIIYR